MKENLILDVIGLGINGEGIAKKDGKIFFIPKALENEMVEVSLLKEKGNLIFCIDNH